METRSQILFTGQLVVESCPTCHIQHAIPKDMQDRMLNDRGPNGLKAYCPSGHHWWYTGKTAAEKAKDRADRAEQQLAAQRAETDQARADAAHQAAVARGYKGAMVQTKKRAAKGVCPVPGCRRHFVDVQRHVESKHPDYRTEAGT